MQTAPHGGGGAWGVPLARRPTRSGPGAPSQLSTVAHVTCPEPITPWPQSPCLHHKGLKAEQGCGVSSQGQSSFRGPRTEPWAEADRRAWGRCQVIVFNPSAPIAAPETPESRDGTPLGNPNPTPLRNFQFRCFQSLQPNGKPTSHVLHCRPWPPRVLDGFLGPPVLTPVCSPTNRARSSKLRSAGPSHAQHRLGWHTRPLLVNPAPPAATTPPGPALPHSLCSGLTDLPDGP